MLVDWLLPRAGMMISFLILSGVMWSSLWLYDDYAAGREARELAEEIVDQIVMVAHADAGYASAGLTRSVKLPDHLHGAAYVLTIEGSQSQLRVEIVGKSKSPMGVAFLPPSVLYYEGQSILELKGFDTIDGDDLAGRISVQVGSELRVTKSVLPRHTLVLEAVGGGG